MSLFFLNFWLQGCPKGITPKDSLKPLVRRLAELPGVKVCYFSYSLVGLVCSHSALILFVCLLQVKMADDCIGKEVEKMVAEIPEGGVLLLENVRFYKEEEKNEPEFEKKLASLADLYVSDAFGTTHQAHASTEGVAK